MISNFIKLAIRNLFKHKLHSFINIFGLSIGLTFSTIIVIYVYHEFNYDINQAKRDNLYRVNTTFLSNKINIGGKSGVASSPAGYAPLLKDRIPEIEHAIRIFPGYSGNILVSHEENSLYTDHFAFTDSSYFQAISHHFLMGDPKNALRKPNNIVITQSIAQSIFGDSNPMGKRIRLQDRFEYVVTGVIENPPSNSTFDFQVIAPISEIVKTLYWPGVVETLSSWDGTTFIALKPNASIALVQQKIDTIVNQPENQAMVQFRLFLEPLCSVHLTTDLANLDRFGGAISPQYLKMLLLIGMLILLLAAINYTNLSLAKSMLRNREIGIRKSLGSDKTSIVIQFLGESTLTTAISVSLMFPLMELFLPLVNNLVGKELSFTTLPSHYLAPGVFLGALILGVLSGLYPALYVSRYSPSNIFRSNNSGSSTSKLVRRGLVMIQFFISIGIISAALMMREQLKYIQNKHLGFEKDNKLVLPLSNGDQLSKFGELKTKLKDKAYIQNITIASTNPGTWAYNQGFLKVGEDPQEDQKTCLSYFVDHDFLETFDFNIIQGRGFDANLASDSNAFVISESAVSVLGYQNPIGKMLVYPNANKTGPIIGVLKDFHGGPMQEAVRPAAFQIQQANFFFYKYITLSLSKEQFSKNKDEILSVWQEVYPAYPFKFFFLETKLSELYKEEEKLSNMITGFSLIAILIAILGLFGLTSFMVERRTKEIGIRKVLGAGIGNVLKLFLVDIFVIIAIAVVAAVPISLYLINKWLEQFAYKVETTALPFVLSIMTVSLIAFITITLQVMKAGRTNPVVSLKQD